MADPTFGLFTAAGSALSLVNTLIKLHQEHAKDPKRYPALSTVMASIPIAALEAADRLIVELDGFERDFKAAGLDLSKNISELSKVRTFWIGPSPRVVSRFQRRVMAIGSELAASFDSVVAIADCQGKDGTLADLIANTFGEAREAKNNLRDAAHDERPVGEIIKTLRSYAEHVKANLGDIGRRR
jgi:hypothetical protein